METLLVKNLDQLTKQSLKIAVCRVMERMLVAVLLAGVLAEIRHLMIGRSPI